MPHAPRPVLPEHEPTAGCEEHVWLHERHWVYVLRSSNDSCVYVGMTINLGTRMQAHKLRDWWPQVERVESWARNNYWSAEREERHLIASLSPEQNVTHAHDSDASTKADPGGWKARRAAMAYRHSRGMTCRVADNCRECNARRRTPVTP